MRSGIEEKGEWEWCAGEGVRGPGEVVDVPGEDEEVSGGVGGKGRGVAGVWNALCCSAYTP